MKQTKNYNVVPCLENICGKTIYRLSAVCDDLMQQGLKISQNRFPAGSIHVDQIFPLYFHIFLARFPSLKLDGAVVCLSFAVILLSSLVEQFFLIELSGEVQCPHRWLVHYTSQDSTIGKTVPLGEDNNIIRLYTFIIFLQYKNIILR